MLVESTRVEAVRLRRSEVDRPDVAALDVRSADHVTPALGPFSLPADHAEDLHRERRGGGGDELVRRDAQPTTHGIATALRTSG